MLTKLTLKKWFICSKVKNKMIKVKAKKPVIASKSNFKATIPVKRYLREILYLTEEFLLQELNKDCIINSYDKNEKITHKSEINRVLFFKYLKEIGAIENISFQGVPQCLVHKDLKEAILYPEKIKFKIVDLEKIKTLTNNILNKNKKQIVSSYKKQEKVFFSEKEPAIICGNQRCKIPYDTLQWYICKIMFKKSLLEPVSWDEILNKASGLEEISDMPNKGDWRKIYDAMREVNKKVKRDLGIEELFNYRKKTIRRLR